MPVKIKNVVKGEIKIIEIQNLSQYPKNIWSEIAHKDIVEIYERVPNQLNSRFNRGRHERKDVEAILTKNPTYHFNNIPNSEDWDQWIINYDDKENQSLESGRDTGNLLPTKTPKTYTPNITIKQIISEYKNSPWVINIVGGLIVIILGSIILKLAGVIH